MKKISLLLIFAAVSFFLSRPALAQDVLAGSKITKVTVYQDRALVTRVADVTLEKGDTSIVFENLPGALMEESLRASGKSAQPVSIYGAELKKVFGPGEADPRVAQIEQELDKLQADLKELNAKVQIVADQKAFLDSVKNFSSVQIPKEIMTKSSTPAEWTGISKFLFDEYVTNSAQSIAVEKAVDDKNKDIEAKQRQLDDINRGRNIEKKTVLVNVNAKDKTTFKIELSYVILDASWTISYDARVNPDERSCQLISYGNIRQRTGEDWNDVALTLSSAKPAIGGKMPEMNPWYVDILQPEPVYRGAARAKMAGMAMMAASAPSESVMSDRAEEAGALQEAVAPQAAVSEELGSVTFDLPRPFTVLSDNRFYKSSVKIENFLAELDYEATPKLMPYAFIHSKITNNKDYALVGGDINIFVKDSFVGKSAIATIGQGEKFDLYLGIDESIKVKRTELVDKRKKSMLGLKTRKDYGYKIELENYSKNPATITVIDQLPVSKNAEIKAELVATSAKPTAKEDLGILKWTVEVLPSEKKSFEFQFYVEYPSDKNVIGL